CPQKTNFKPNCRIRGSPDPGSVLVIRPRVAWLLTAVFGTLKFTWLKMLKNSTRAWTDDELLKRKFFDNPMSQLCSDGPSYAPLPLFPNVPSSLVAKAAGLKSQAQLRPGVVGTALQSAPVSFARSLPMPSSELSVPLVTVNGRAV